MLYATKDEAVAEKVSGMITLATPFITVRRRKLPRLIPFAFIVIALFGIFEAMFRTFGETFLSIPIVPKEASLNAVILIAIWLVATLVSSLLYRLEGKSFGIGNLFRLLRGGENADAIIDKELHRMKLTSDDDQLTRDRYEKLLVARPIGDEASMSLIVTQFLSWFENRILTAMTSKVKQFFSGIGFFSWIWKILLLVGVFILTAKNLFPVSLPWLSAWSDDLFSMVHYAPRGLIIVILGDALAVILLYGFLSLITLLGPLVAGLGFGLDAMFWNHFVSTTAERSPPGAARVFLQSLPADPSGLASAGLAHSGIYTDPQVIDEIIDWIESREKDLGESAPD